MQSPELPESIFDSMIPIEQLTGSPLSMTSPLMDAEERSHADYDLLPQHWRKIEMDFPDLSIDAIFSELHSDLKWTDVDELFFHTVDDVLTHDCMWAGHCSGSEHEEPLCNVRPQPQIKKETVPPPSTETGDANKQQSLLKPSVKAAGSTWQVQTPPESDDDEKANNSTLLKLLNDAINECDSDLTEYFEGKGDDVDIKAEPLEIKEELVEVKKEEITEEDSSESEQEEDQQMSYEEFVYHSQMAAENDHSYHSKCGTIRHSNYGLDTPSDSEEEEEIDVVSVNEKHTSDSRNMFPNNPSCKDRDQIQRRMATAIRRSGTGGIKTILPVNRQQELATANATASTSGTGRRGVKRGKSNRGGNNGNNKRRRTNPDGQQNHQQQPADKRHLHNNMERQRRVDLRKAFENLKSVVPEVSGAKKIAKVNILQQAAQYCYYLTATNANQIKQMEDLRKRQAWLRSRVSQLRRNLAATR
ncbi:hypothetical protein ABEB36_001012 [Hypothenemus hampei]|uniref:BHLH domain-containing protein n=1 Tax=Hypothenemus hampei TaxID=57062 RepID=A0ABD1FD62_HYPHA